MKLINIVEIIGTIELKSGLHIGSGDNEMHIGGTDNPVIKHPHTNDPYIPGSSVKGKMRSLLEWHAGLVEFNQGKPFGYKQLDAVKQVSIEKYQNAKNLIKLFGISGGDSLDQLQAKEIGPSRLSFRDSAMSFSWRDQISERNLPLTEIKFENSINRISGTAENPRNTERVPAGAEFDFVLCLKQLEGDDTEALMAMVITGLKLLEMDALGGSGSRGYGKLRFHLDDAGLQQQLNALDPFGQAA